MDGARPYRVAAPGCRTPGGLGAAAQWRAPVHVADAEPRPPGALDPVRWIALDPDGARLVPIAAADAHARGAGALRALADAGWIDDPARFMPLPVDGPLFAADPSELAPLRAVLAAWRAWGGRNGEIRAVAGRGLADAAGTYDDLLLDRLRPQDPADGLHPAGLRLLQAFAALSAAVRDARTRPDRLGAEKRTARALEALGRVWRTTAAGRRLLDREASAALARAAASLDEPTELDRLLFGHHGPKARLHAVLRAPRPADDFAAREARALFGDVALASAMLSDLRTVPRPDNATPISPAATTTETPIR